MSGSDLRRAVVCALTAGAALGLVLIASRGLLGGRPLPFWLENTAGIWFATAFAAGAATRRLVAGATAGAAALVVGLLLHDAVWLSTGDGLTIQILPVVRHTWVVISVVAGAVVGGAAGWAGSVRRRWSAVVGVVGGLVLGEAAALAIAPPHPAFDQRVAIGQGVVAVLAVVAATRDTAWRRALAVAAVVAAVVVAVELATGLVGRAIWG